MLVLHKPSIKPTCLVLRFGGFTIRECHQMTRHIHGVRWPRGLCLCRAVNDLGQFISIFHSVNRYWELHRLCPTVVTMGGQRLWRHIQCPLNSLLLSQQTYRASAAYLLLAVVQRRRYWN
jgi:hypothetical protein